jgi:hypothetical protein
MEPILLAGEVHLRLPFFRRRKGNTLFRQNGSPCYGKISRHFCLLNNLKKPLQEIYF